MKYAGPIVRRRRRGSWPRIQRSAIGPSAGADAARAVEHADAGRRAAADRKDPLAEDRQQQQHAAGQPPAGLHEHQRRDVRSLADVAEPLEQIGDAGEREEPGRPRRRRPASSRSASGDEVARTRRTTRALTTNATLRPASAVTRPPIDAPIASIADQVALDSALAGISSSADVMLGIVAVRAGSKNACAPTMSAITT